MQHPGYFPVPTSIHFRYLLLELYEIATVMNGSLLFSSESSFNASIVVISRDLRGLWYRRQP